MEQNNQHSSPVRVAVLGTGGSIAEYRNEFDVTVGVNDIWRHTPVDAIVCVDNPRAFTAERYRTIHDSTPQRFYSQMVAWDKRPDFVQITIRPGYPDGYMDLRAGGGYYKSYCSPFIACQVAWREYHASEIHLFGVDLVNHPHLKADICQKIKLHFRLLKAALIAVGCRLVVHGEGILKEI